MGLWRLAELAGLLSGWLVAAWRHLKYSPRRIEKCSLVNYKIHFVRESGFHHFLNSWACGAWLGWLGYHFLNLWACGDLLGWLGCSLAGRLLLGVTQSTPLTGLIEKCSLANCKMHYF